MLSVLTVSEVLAIAEAATARARDQRAMDEYLYPGSNGFLPLTPAQIAADAAAGRFDSAERARLEQLVSALSLDARRELMALMLLGRGDTNSFETAMSITKSNHAAVHYLSLPFMPSGVPTANLIRVVGDRD